MINRALLWKELRMQRPVLLAGVAVAVLGPLLVLAMLSTARDIAYWDLVRALRVVLAGTWPFLAVAAGAITFATEAEDGTARFLLSRPVSRARVWCVKVGAAAGVLAVTGLLSLLAIRVVALLAGSPPADWRMSVGYTDWTLFVGSTVLGLGLLFFACGVLCSTVVARPLTAAAAAVAVGLAMLSLVFMLWSAVGLRANLEPQWLGVEMIALSAILVGISLLVFTWPEQFGRGAVLDVAGRAGAASVLALLLVAILMPATFALMTPAVDEVTVVPGSVVFGGQSIALTMRDSAGTTQNWLLMTDGSGARPFTGRHTLAPQWTGTSINRGSIAYYSRRGVLGTEGRALDLRVTDSSGAMSWTAFRDMPGVRELFFHNYRGAILAFVDAGDIVVAQLSGYGHRRIATRGTPLEGAALLGFGYRESRDSSPQLVMVDGDYDLATSTLRADGSVFLYEVDNGAVHELTQLAAGSVLPALLRNPLPDARAARGNYVWARSLVPILTVRPGADGAADVRLVRVQSGGAGDGEIQPVYDIPTAWNDAAERAEFERCAAVELASDRRWSSDETARRSFNEGQVLFGDCSVPTRAELGEGAIRLVGVRTGNVVTWPLPPGWRGRLNRIHLSQRQRTALLDIRGATPAESYAMTIDLDGGAHVYPTGWVALGWTSPDYFVLQREEHDAVTFAVGDARNGEIYDLFPNNELRAVLEQRRLEQQRQQEAGAATARGGQ